MIRRGLCSVLMLLGLGSALAQAGQQHWVFEVFLDDRAIGEQRFTVLPEADSLRVDIEARFDVDFLFFNAYDYQHRNTERWRGDCLDTLESETDDNGTRYRLRGSRRDDGFHLEVNGEPTLLPACVMSFAYWNPAILDQSALLNTQDGRLMPVRVATLGEETIGVNDEPVAAERFRLEAEDLTIDLWYAREDRRWLKLESLVEGNRLRFHLREHDGRVAALP